LTSPYLYWSTGYTLTAKFSGQIGLAELDKLIEYLENEDRLRVADVDFSSCCIGRFLVNFSLQQRDIVPATWVACPPCIPQTPSPVRRLLALVGAGLAILNATFQGDGAPLVASIALCGIVFAVAFSLVRWLGPAFIKAGLKGKDMAKPSRPEMYVYGS
jgi:hypothetical protein